MNEEALHTEIVERKTVGDIKIIREKYYEYPKGNRTFMQKILKVKLSGMRNYQSRRIFIPAQFNGIKR